MRRVSSTWVDALAGIVALLALAAAAWTVVGLLFNVLHHLGLAIVRLFS